MSSFSRSRAFTSSSFTSGSSAWCLGISHGRLCPQSPGTQRGSEAGQGAEFPHRGKVATREMGVSRTMRTPTDDDAPDLDEPDVRGRIPTSAGRGARSPRSWCRPFSIGLRSRGRAAARVGGSSRLRVLGRETASTPCWVRSVERAVTQHSCRRAMRRPRRSWRSATRSTQVALGSFSLHRGQEPRISSTASMTHASTVSRSSPWLGSRCARRSGPTTSRRST